VFAAILEGWQFNGAGRFQRRTTNFGNVRLVGMTKAEAQKLKKKGSDPFPNGRRRKRGLTLFSGRESSRLLSQLVHKRHHD
jgi:hypothetical protein